MSIVKIRAALETALNTIAGIIPSVAITSSALGASATFTTATPHLLVNNVLITIASHSGSTPSLNGNWLVVVTGASTFTLLHPVTKVAVASTAGGTGGTVTANLTAWDGVAFAPVPLVPYQRVNLVPATPENPTYGGNHSRELGFLQVSLYYPVQRGTYDVMTRAELIRTTFPRGSSFTSSGVTVHVNKKPEIIVLPISEENIIVVVRVPYWSDLFS